MRTPALFALLSVTLAVAARADAPPLSREAEDIFKRSARAIVQIECVDTRSGAKNSYGTGFRVQPEGLLITNYHVVSTLVFHPESYRIMAIGPDRQESEVRVLDIDVVHDVALLSAPTAPGEKLQLRTAPLEKGARLFALGFPNQLGLTVVEGNYNGLLDHLHERIHFTGSVNPGMSGGPALGSDGDVMGVNVATMGNQVGFLVPIDHARKLLDSHKQRGGAAATDLVRKVRDQLLEHQDGFAKSLLATTYPVVPLGPYRVPGKLASYMKSWGQSSDDPKNLFQASRYSNEMPGDAIYISEEQRTGTISFDHLLLSTDALDRFRFANLFESYLGRAPATGGASSEDVTNFRSTSGQVECNGVVWKATLSFRAYKKLPQLYDAVLRAGTLMENRRALVTTLIMAGVSYDNAVKLARKHLEAIAWKP